MINLPWLAPEQIEFPNTDHALEEPNGLLAAGGALSPEWLLTAYERGIFPWPWFSDDDPILWWSPSPRTILYLDQLHISKSLRKALRKDDVIISFDSAFSEVVNACAQPRSNEDDPGTWITEEIKDAYIHLHELGFAHSIEVKCSLVSQCSVFKQTVQNLLYFIWWNSSNNGNILLLIVRFTITTCNLWGLFKYHGKNLRAYWCNTLAVSDRKILQNGAYKVLFSLNKLYFVTNCTQHAVN